MAESLCRINKVSVGGRVVYDQSEPVAENNMPADTPDLTPEVLEYLAGQATFGRPVSVHNRTVSALVAAARDRDRLAAELAEAKRENIETKRQLEVACSRDSQRLTAAEAEVERLNRERDADHKATIRRFVTGEGEAGPGRYGSVPEMLADQCRSWLAGAEERAESAESEADRLRTALAEANEMRCPFAIKYGRLCEVPTPESEVRT